MIKVPNTVKMTKVGLVKFIILVLFSQTVVAQKVKYKDIFGLLSTKQYAEAEPFLKRYLAENDDNPNAFLYMGIIYQEKADANDILKQTKPAIENMDSAVFFYDKAHQTITDKEIRKNKEYYQSYNRRDLRTGEFGVKLSDIQFDLEKKIELLKERRDKIKMVKYYFVLADSLYKRCTDLFVTIQNAYAGEREFLLQGNDSSLTKLSALSARFDSTMKAFDNYKASLQTLGNAAYNQTAKLKEIGDFKRDGATPCDFLQNELWLWDYRKFAADASEKIRKEIMPMHERLVSYDIEINKLREKLNNDSASVRNDLARLTDKSLMSQLKKFDEDPLPANVFSMKMADLEYKSSLIEHKSLRDSLDWRLQLQLTQIEQTLLSQLDSIAGKLVTTDIDKEAGNYRYFVTNTYGNSVVLKSYIKALKDFAEREQRRVSREMERCTESLRWVFSTKDTIPLFMDGNNTRFKPLVIEKDRYTAGLSYTDSLTMSGYFYSITPSRRPDVMAEFPVDKENFKLSRLPLVKSLTVDSNQQIFFVLIYSEQKQKEKYPVTVAKIYRSDGLAWTKNYQLSFVPSALAYQSDSGELTIQSGADVRVLDKNGKVVK